MRGIIYLCLAASVLAGCNTTGTGEKIATAKAELKNISFEGSPNKTDVGFVDANSATVAMSVGEKTLIGGLRAGNCGAAAPDFASLMHDQIGREGLRVPDGVTLYDGGVGGYHSRSCSRRVAARAISAIADEPGVFELRFINGQLVKTLEVE